MIKFCARKFDFFKISYKILPLYFCTKTKNMARRKINVVSNELDQAPKTRAAGYGKVVNSMRKEISEAMDRIFLNGSKVIAGYMNHSDRIPVEELLELKPGDHLSFEVKREEVKYDWFTETAWYATSLWGFNNFIDRCLKFKEEWPIKPGQKSTIIVVEKDAKDPKIWNIHAEQLEYPGEWAMFKSGLFFYDPNVSDEKFQEIVWTEYKKEELKEQIKENINEEIELEEMEGKEGKKSKQNKWDKSKDVNFKERKVGEPDKKSLWDTIKWWFK